MRRLLSMALCCALALACTGCGGTGSGDEWEAYGLYFLESDLTAAGGGGVFRTETIYLDKHSGEDSRQLAQTLLTALLDGPVDETLKSPFPAGTRLLSVSVEGSRATVDLSGGYGTLSGVNLTLADYAVALTLTQLTDVLSVKITVRGRELAYRDKQVFTARDVRLAPEGDVINAVPVTLYFLDSDGMLAPEERLLELYEGDTQVSAVAKALENGPESKELTPPLPENFQVRSVWQEEDVCYVNLSSGLVEEGPDGGTLSRALGALGRSLCSLDTVGEVRFLVDGEYAARYGGVDISDPYTA